MYRLTGKTSGWRAALHSGPTRNPSPERQKNSPKPHIIPSQKRRHPVLHPKNWPKKTPHTPALIMYKLYKKNKRIVIISETNKSKIGKLNNFAMKKSERKEYFFLIKSRTLKNCS